MAGAGAAETQALADLGIRDPLYDCVAGYGHCGYLVAQ